MDTLFLLAAPEILDRLATHLNCMALSRLLLLAAVKGRWGAGILKDGGQRMIGPWLSRIDWRGSIL